MEFNKMEFNKMKKSELLAYAKKQNIKVSPSLTKDEIIAILEGKTQPPKAKKEEVAKPKVKKVEEAKVEKVLTENKHEEIVTVTKFAQVPPKPVETFVPPKEEAEKLPSGYGKTRIVLLVRDPLWIYSYWEITQESIDFIKAQLGDKFGSSKKILRVYDTTGITFDGTNANSFFDISLTAEAENWYIQVPAANRSYCTEIGYLTEDGKFYPVARSNVVTTPRETFSEIVDEEWMVIDRDFEKLYQLSGGLSSGISSAEFKQRLLERLAREISSPGISSISSISRIQEKPKGFWLNVDTELIVYGATEPDAEVTIQGKPVKLNPDGSFSVRFALPDGKHTIDVKAVSKDKEEVREITPVVIRKTE